MSARTVGLVLGLAVAGCAPVAGTGVTPGPSSTPGVAGPELDRMAAANLMTVEMNHQYGVTDARTVGGFALLLTSGANPTESCPVVTQRGDTRTFTGGCTDSEGRTYVGSATVVTQTDGTLRATLENFGSTTTERCVDITRSVTLTGTATGTYVVDQSDGSFTADIKGNTASADRSACTVRTDTVAVSFTGTYARTGADEDRDGQPDQQVWNGTGRIGIGSVGQWETTTRDERIDPATCPTEPTGGTLEARSGGHTVVISYDGASSCQRTGSPTAPWTFDGVQQSEQTRVTACSVGLVGAGSKGMVAGVAAACALGMAAAWRRRRRA